MARLTKEEAKWHAEAELLLTKPKWDDDDREFFLKHWQESANHVNSAAGAFFTPLDYALDFALEVGGGPLIDVCAGIGNLTYAVTFRQRYSQYPKATDLVCVELNEAYAAIGQKLVPDAHWIVGNAFEELPKLGKKFTHAISNPPFGRIKHDGKPPRYTGAKFEYKIIDLVADYADYGAFILPSGSAPFSYSGAPFYDRRQDNPEYQKLETQTGIILDAGIGIDTSIYSAWHGVQVSTEVCITDYTVRERPQLPTMQHTPPAPPAKSMFEEPELLDTLF